MASEFIVPGTNGMQRFWRLNASGADEIGGNTLSVSNTTYKKTPRGYQTYCATANGSNSSLTSGVTVSGVRTLFFSIYPTANNRTFLTATGITITINSSSQIATSGLTGVSVSVNGQPTTAIVLNAWNFVAVTHDSANYASVNVFASSFIGDAQEVGTFDRVISETEIRNWYLENLRSLGGSTLAGLMDGCVAQINTTDGNELSDIVGGVAVTKTSGTATTDNLGYTRAITNPNYSWTSVTYTTGYAFEDAGSGWVLTQTPSGLSATGINRTTTLREVFLFNRTLSADEKNALETLCKLDYVLPFDGPIRYSLPHQLKEGCVLFIPGDLSGTTAYDASGNSNHGTIVNSPTPTRGGLHGYEGLKFDGTNRYVNFGDVAALDFGTGDFTIACNIVVYDNTDVGIANKSPDNDTPNGFAYYVDGSGKLGFFTVNSGYTTVAGATTLSTGVMYRAMYVRKGTSHSVYLNGVLDGTTVGTVRSISNSQDFVWGKARSNTYYGNGYYANLLIHNRALSADEIRLDALTFFIP